MALSDNARGLSGSTDRTARCARAWRFRSHHARPVHRRQDIFGIWLRCRGPSDALAIKPLSVRLVTNSIAVMSILAASGDGIVVKTKVGLNPAPDGAGRHIVSIKDRILPLQHLAILTRRGLLKPALARALLGGSMRFTKFCYWNERRYPDRPDQACSG